ncbi:MAG: bifunctional aldolase/short-chain dehydrogenase [Phycisphaerales bacterium JB040]
MKSLWNDADAAKCADDLGLRVYSSRLLGADESLVMHGGGNTSVKSAVRDFFGDQIEALLVKGSGWDLGTIERPGFTALRLAETQRLATLDELSDLDMTRELTRQKLDPGAPSPSVEAILHAVLPAKFVDHTHTDAVVTLTNTPNGESLTRELYPDCLVLPYVMPGFILSKQVADAIAGEDLGKYTGIVLLHHGVFTWGEDAKSSYERMIELVDRAERYLAEHGTVSHGTGEAPTDLDGLARIRKAVSSARGRAQLAVLDRSADAVGYASRDDIAEIATRGPITPDHVIRTKRVPVVIAESPGEGVPEVGAYAESYRAYFEANRHDGLTMLDPAPRAGVWRRRGTLAFGSTPKECAVIADIARHTRWAIQTAESLDEPNAGWAALSEQEIFDLEYWSLEQAKLKKAAPPTVHTGKVAVVTGAMHGIGRAICEQLKSDGAVVVGLDIDPRIEGELGASGMQGVVCDVTDEAGVRAGVEAAVERYGGIDIAVSNAGVFRPGERVADMTDDAWETTLRVNLTGAQRFLRHASRFLVHGVDATAIVVGSRNVAAPGPGAGAYSASKAGLTQLARVLALELAPHGVRVNTVHPDAVFDTALWTEDTLRTSAERYGLTVEQYKARNLMKREVTSADVGRLVSAMAGPAFALTTGAQVPIDGGNDRVI